MSSASTAGLVRSSSVMAVGTIVSRITGMVRNSMVVAAIGTAVFADTYSIANALPNIVYILVAGGALNAVFVPQLVRHMKDDADDGIAYGQRLVSAVTLVLLALSVVAVLLAPWLVRLYATASWSAQDFAVSTAFARYCLPQILFYGVFTMLSQVLNARGHFAAPMFAPIVNNVVVMGAAAAFLVVVGTDPTTASVTSGEVALLGVGTTLGVVAQAVVLLPFLHRTGFHWRLRGDLRGAGLGKAFALAKWTMVLVLINQVGYLFITRMATSAAVQGADSSATDAGFTVYSSAHLVFMLPQSVVTVSVVTALLPLLSRQAHAGQFPAMRREIARALRLTGALVVPAAAAFVALGPQIGVLLFGYGSAGASGGEVLGTTLAAFALGLPAFSAYYVLLRGFYSLEDTRTPAFVAVLLNVLNVGLAFAFYRLLPPGEQVPGLALGYSLAYSLTLVVLWQLLRRRLDGLETYDVVRAHVRIVLASVVAGLVAWGAAALAARPFSPGFVQALAAVGAGLALGGSVYLWLARRMRVRELALVVDRVAGRLRRP